MSKPRNQQMHKASPPATAPSAQVGGSNYRTALTERPLLAQRRYISSCPDRLASLRLGKLDWSRGCTQPIVEHPRSRFGLVADVEVT